MKRNILLIAFCLLTVVAFGQDKRLTILHTNDTHSQIYPLSVNLADTMKAGRAGFLRRIAMLKEERRKQPDLLLFDSGDFSQGSPYYTMFKGDVEVGLMNRMHYDAATIGNHEFDFGLDNMARLFRMANFPIVCANYDFKGTELEKLVKPYVILKRNGLNPVKCAQKVIDELKAKKCDLIICLSHLGWNIEGVSDEEVIAGTHGLDLVLGGHSHTYLTKLEYVKDLDGKMVGDDQNGKHAIYVGKLVLDMKKKK